MARYRLPRHERPPTDATGRQGRSSAARPPRVASPEGLGPSEVLFLQHAAGNRAVAELLQRPVQPGAGLVVQRRNGAVPQNFRITTTTSDNATCEVVTHTAWDSSTGHLGDLDDVLSREVVTFNTDPTTRMPSYAGLPVMDSRYSLAGKVMTKRSGMMRSGSGSDRHSGAGHGPKFTVGGVPNLQKGEWKLVGVQFYEYQLPGDTTWNRLHTAPFSIWRQMARKGDVYELTLRKTGPGGVNVSAGPTPIGFETTEAMAALATQKADQTADWNALKAKLTGGGFTFHQVAQDVKTVGGTQVTIIYEITAPDNFPPDRLGVRPLYLVSDKERDVIVKNARAGVDTVIKKALQAGTAPSTIIITISKEGRQQAFSTNENGHTYRVFLRVGKLLNRSEWGAHLHSSISGREAQRGKTASGKTGRFIKGAAVHEIGHMLHAFTSPEKYMAATLMPPVVAAFPATDPHRPEMVHVAAVNGRVMQALQARDYKLKWSYAQENPAEVVAEVFNAVMSGRNVPAGLAAVYLAYGGRRSAEIDKALQKVLGAPLPNFRQPEDAIARI